MDQERTGHPAEDAKVKASRDLVLQQYNAHWGEIQLHRAVYDAHRRARMTFREIADVLGCAPSWAHKLFRKHLAHRAVVEAEHKEQARYGAPD